MRGIHRPPVNSLHKGQWRGALMFSLICAWINGWINNREAGDLRCYRAHYDGTVMLKTLRNTRSSLTFICTDLYYEPRLRRDICCLSTWIALNIWQLRNTNVCQASTLITSMTSSFHVITTMDFQRTIALSNVNFKHGDTQLSHTTILEINHRKTCQYICETIRTSAPV